MAPSGTQQSPPQDLAPASLSAISMDTWTVVMGLESEVHGLLIQQRPQEQSHFAEDQQVRQTWLRSGHLQGRVLVHSRAHLGCAGGAEAGRRSPQLAEDHTATAASLWPAASPGQAFGTTSTAWTRSVEFTVFLRIFFMVT